MATVVNESTYWKVSTLFAGAFSALIMMGKHVLFASDQPSQLVYRFDTWWDAFVLAFGAFFVVRLVFEQWLWRWRIFRSWLVLVPDLSGNWKGELYSLSFDRRFDNVVEIRHMFGRVQYTSWRETEAGDLISTESTIVCEVRRDATSGQIELVVVYQNQPGGYMSKDEFGHVHQGCAVIRLVNENLPREEWTLSGDYWTNKPWGDKGGTRGNITLRRRRS
jgi:hypothetical protein